MDSTNTVSDVLSKMEVIEEDGSVPVPDTTKDVTIPVDAGNENDILHDDTDTDIDESIPYESIIRPIGSTDLHRPPDSQVIASDMDIGEDKEKKPRGRPRKATVSRSEIMKYIQSADRVRIYMRKRASPFDAGHLSYVGDYTAKELRECGAVDAFVKQYIVPHYGYGEFAIELVKADGTVINAGMVDVSAPIGATVSGDGKSTMSLESMFDKIAKLAADSDKKIEETVEKRRKEFLDLKASLGPGNVDQSGLMLMMMQLQQAKPGTDYTAALVEAMKELVKQDREREHDRGKYRELLPPMNLPMLPSESSSSADTVAKAMCEVAKTMKGDSLSAKDMIALMQANKPQERPLTDIVDSIVKMVPVARQMLGLDELHRRMEEQSRRNEELMREMRDNGRLGITDVMRQAHELRGFMQEFGGGRDIDSFWTTVNATVDRIPKIIESIKGLKEEKRQKQLTASSITPASKEVNLEIPDDTVELLKKLESITDNAELIGGYLEVLQMLMKIPEWKTAMTGGMQAIYSGDKAKSMVFVKSVLEGLRDGEHISSDLFKRSLEAFDNDFEELSRALKSK